MRVHLRSLGYLASLLALTACGRSVEPANTTGSGPVVTAPLEFTGRLVLDGSFAASREGGVLVRLVEQTTGRIVLQRIYDLGDPAWDRRDREQALYFALDPDCAFDARPPVRAPLLVEAVHLPPGIAAEPSAADERVAVVAEPGARDLDLLLHGAAEVAGAHSPAPR